MIKIPFTEYPAYSQDVAIEETVYRLSFVWNTRDSSWSMNISDLDDNMIVAGIKLVLTYDLLKTYKHLNIPKGNLYVLDETGNEDEIKYDDFDNTKRNLQLIYLTEEEYAAL